MARVHRQAAVIPYRIRKARIEVALVTTSKGNGWIVPKGSIDDGERARDAAIREAEEEAGLRGVVARRRLAGRGAEGVSALAWQPRDGRARLTARLTGPVNFSWDFPDGPLAQALAPVIGVRRLLPQADAEEHGTALDILDDRRKTVAR